MVSCGGIKLLESQEEIQLLLLLLLLFLLLLLLFLLFLIADIGFAACCLHITFNEDQNGHRDLDAPNQQEVV